MDRLLPFTPKPQPGESPLALLRRAASGNHHPRTTRFVYGLHSGFDHSITGVGALVRNPDRWRAFSHAIGIDAADQPQSGFQRIGQAKKDKLVWLDLQIAADDIDVRRTKICVACLLESGYGLAEWDHVAAVGCARHRTLLQSSCAGCGAAWSPLDHPLDCGCIAEAVTQQAQPCSAEAASLLHRIVDARDQQGLDRLSRLWRLLGEWRNLGIPVSQLNLAEALPRLYAGQWPTVDTGTHVAGERLHPRVALASLLESARPDIRGHAGRLLRQPMPAMHAPMLRDLRWSRRRSQVVLGVGRAALRELLQSGILGSDGRGRILAASVNELLWRLESGPDSPAGEAALTSLRAGRQRATTSAVLAAVVDGTLQPCGDGLLVSGLSSLRLSGVSAPAPALSAGAALEDVARRLGANVESVKAVIRLGILPGSLRTIDGCRRWFVESGIVEAFEQEFVFASRLSKDIGRAPTTLASRLRHAGITPVSGPGIDVGVSYLFRRADLVSVNVEAIAIGAYRSPAGRKRGQASIAPEVSLSSRAVATRLGIPPSAVAVLVRQGWLTRQGHAAAFTASQVDSMVATVAGQYIEVDEAASQLGQTRQAFLRTWVISEFMGTKPFGGKLLVPAADFQRAFALWQDLATAAVVGASLGRGRDLCPNLQKMGLIEPALVIGQATRNVRLYRRSEPIFEKYRMPSHLQS